MSDDDQYEGLGDTGPEDSGPSGDNEERSQPSTQPQPKQKSKLGQKARQRIKNWQEKRNKAKQAKEMAKKFRQVQKNLKRGEQAVKAAKLAAGAASSETIIGPILIWLFGKALQLGKIAAKALTTNNYSQAASEAEKSTKKPIIIASCIIGVLFFLMIVVVFGGFFMTTAGVVEQDRLMKLAAANDILLSVTKNGPETANVGDEITYTINVSSKSPEFDASISDPLPNGLEFVKASQTVTCSNTPDNSCNGSSKVINWSSKTNNLTPPLNTSFTITAKVTSAANNTYAVNLATGIIATRSATAQ